MESKNFLKKGLTKIHSVRGISRDDGEDMNLLFVFNIYLTIFDFNYFYNYYLILKSPEGINI